jgi:hypothetical protein
MKTMRSPDEERWKTSRLAVMPTVETYAADPLYPRIVRAVDAILARGKVVAPVDVLVGMHLLTAKRLEVWRRGRVPYLEKVIVSNLTRLSRLLRILRFSRTRPESGAQRHRVYALGEGTEAAAALHQDRRSEARGSVRTPFRLAGQGPLPPTRAEGDARVTAWLATWRRCIVQCRRCAGSAGCVRRSLASMSPVVVAERRPASGRQSQELSASRHPVRRCAARGWPRLACRLQRRTLACVPPCWVGAFRSRSSRSLAQPAAPAYPLLGRCLPGPPVAAREGASYARCRTRPGTRPQAHARRRELFDAFERRMPLP